MTCCFCGNTPEEENVVLVAEASEDGGEIFCCLGCLRAAEISRCPFCGDYRYDEHLETITSDQSPDPCLRAWHGKRVCVGCLEQIEDGDVPMHQGGG